MKPSRLMSLRRFCILHEFEGIVTNARCVECILEPPQLMSMFIENMVSVCGGDLKSIVGMLRFKVILEVECVLEPPQLMRCSFSNNHDVGESWRSEIQRWHVAIQCHSGIEMRSGTISVEVSFLSNSPSVVGHSGSETQRWHVVIQGRFGMWMRSEATSVEVILLKKLWCRWALIT